MIRRSSEYTKHQIKAQNQDIFVPLVIKKKRSAEEKSSVVIEKYEARYIVENTVVQGSWIFLSQWYGFYESKNMHLL